MGKILSIKAELNTIRTQIDAYDLIKSGFANDLDDVSAIYWTLSNTGGMDDVDLAQFVERMKTVKALVGRWCRRWSIGRSAHDRSALSEP